MGGPVSAQFVISGKFSKLDRHDGAGFPAGPPAFSCSLNATQRTMYVIYSFISYSSLNQYLCYTAYICISLKAFFSCLKRRQIT